MSDPNTGIRFVTPAQRHNGEDKALLEQRKLTYRAAKASNPMRWSRGTRNWDWIEAVSLNPDKPNTAPSNQTAERVH